MTAKRGAAQTQSPGHPSSPGLCETCDTTGFVPAWDELVGAYMLTTCPDCPEGDHIKKEVRGETA